MGWFDALSYAWGDPKSTVPIIVNGHTVHATHNLEEALRQFRCESAVASLLLWVDAICINQGDDEERGKQVAIMHHIYEETATVRIWLGKGNPAMSRGLEILERLTSCRCDEIDGRRGATCLTGAYNILHQLEWQDFAFLAEVCRAPYWQRVWIIQEAAMGDSIILYYGSRQGRVRCWQHLAFVVDAMFKLLGMIEARTLWTRLPPEAKGAYKTMQFHQESYIPHCPSSAPAIAITSRALKTIPRARDTVEDIIFRNADPSSIITSMSEMIHLFRNQKCLDPRDHVYGFVGIFRGFLSIKPDYKKTVREVFEDATIQIMICTESAEILQQAASKNITLPSWVPDFQEPGHAYRYCGTPIDASPFTGVRISPSHPGLLQVRAFLFDRVRSTHHGPSGVMDPLFFESYDFWDWGASSRQSAKSRQDFERLLLTDDISIPVLGWHFKTTNGYTGQMENECRVGDYVCILVSSCQIFCIREAETRFRSTFSLIGACVMLDRDMPTDYFKEGRVVKEAAKARFGDESRADEVFSPIILI